MRRVPDPVRVMYNLTFAVQRQPDAETGFYESRCLQLGTSSVGRTIEEAIENIRDAAELELSVFDTSPQLVKYLREHGVTVWTDGDAIREQARRQTTQLEYGELTMPEQFSRELANA